MSVTINKFYNKNMNIFYITFLDTLLSKAMSTLLFFFDFFLTFQIQMLQKEPFFPITKGFNSVGPCRFKYCIVN